MEEKLNVDNVEVACVTPDKGYHTYPESELEPLIKQAAEEALREGDVNMGGGAGAGAGSKP